MDFGICAFCTYVSDLYIDGHLSGSLSKDLSASSLAGIRRDSECGWFPSGATVLAEALSAISTASSRTETLGVILIEGLPTLTNDTSTAPLPSSTADRDLGLAAAVDSLLPQLGNANDTRDILLAVTPMSLSPPNPAHYCPFRLFYRPAPHNSHRRTECGGLLLG